jgi:hypothetical protein
MILLMNMMLMMMMVMMMMMMRRPSSLRVRAKPRHLPYIYICNYITSNIHHDVCLCVWVSYERMRWLQDGIHGLPCKAAHASRSLGLLSLWQEQARTDCEGTRNIKIIKAFKGPLKPVQPVAGLLLHSAGCHCKGCDPVDLLFWSSFQARRQPFVRLRHLWFATYCLKVSRSQKVSKGL